MKIKIFTLLIAVFLNSAVFSQNSSYEIATWKGFRTSAASFTFDDNCANQFSNAVPIFDSLGYKASFYPVISWYPNWSTLQTLVNNGHEVGSHSFNHGNPMPDSEIGSSKNTIDQNISGQVCNTITYPNCNEPSETEVARYYIGGRICDGQVQGKTPSNYFRIGSIICGSQGSCNSLNNFQTQLNTAISRQGWVVFQVQEVDNGSGASPLASSIIESTLSYIKDNDNLIWLTTFRNAILYSKERNAATITELTNTATEITLSITDNLDNAIYNYPISIKRELPNGWTNVIVKQNDVVIESNIVGNYIYFDAVPDAGTCAISLTYFIPETATVCNNDLPYTWRGTDYSIAGVYYDSLQTATGCDSVYQLTLNVNPTYFISETDTVNNNDLPYSWHGTDFSIAGVYYDTLQTQAGCDSIHTLSLTITTISLTIDNLTDLVAFRNAINDGTDAVQYKGIPLANGGAGMFFTLTADLDLSSVCGVSVNGSEVSWTPIGTDSNQFKGTFNGDGHTISNLYINDSGSYYLGLFGNVKTAALSNFTVSGEITVSGSFEVGAIGSLRNSTAANIISHINITETEGASCHVGGVVGELLYDGSGSVNKCSYYGTIRTTNSYNCIGGIVGYANENQSITNCANYGVVNTGNKSDAYTGGILGYVNNKSFTALSNCLNIGTINGSGSYYGTIVGWQRQSATVSVITNNYYLHSSCAYAFGNNSQYKGTATAKTSAQMSSGEVAYLLGDAYGQNIGTDTVPVFRNNTNQVFRVLVVAQNSFPIDTFYCNAQFTIPSPKSYYQWSDHNVGDLLTITKDTAIQCVSNEMNIICSTVQNGAFSTDKATAHSGDTVRITVTPADEYELKLFHVTTANGGTVTVNADSTFIMPAGYDVTVSGEFRKILTTEVGTDGLTYYLISNEAELTEFGSRINAGNPSINGKLTADITLTETWTPMGTSTYPYAGTFDGAGYRITNLNVNISINGAGLFGVAGNGAKFKNITIAGGTIQTSGQYAGGIVGYTPGGNEGTISFDRCANYAAVYSSGTNTSANAAGIYGCNVNSKFTVTMTNCYNAGAIGNASRNDSKQENGGLSGWMGNNAVLSYCYNVGTLYGTANNNSLLIRHTSATITNAYYLNTLAGSEKRDSYTAATQAKFASGEVAYLLGDTYGQNIGTDTVPVFRNNTNQVFRVLVVAQNSFPIDTFYCNAQFTIPSPKSYYQWSDHNVGDLLTITKDTAIQCVSNEMNIICSTVQNGAFSTDKATAHSGDTVRITVTPADEYELKLFHVTTANGGTVTVNADSTFIMPAGYDVTVSGEFRKILTTEVGTDGLTYYLISNEAELTEFGSRINEGNPSINGKLTADITLTETWTPMGTTTYLYAGTFDGDNYTISNLYINSSDSDYQGLFGVVAQGTVTRLNLVNTNISGKDYVGGIAGFIVYSSTISYCTNSGSVSGIYYVGGIAGLIVYSSTISYCTNSGSVSGTNIYVGGIAGYNYNNSTIEYCTNSGSVSGTAYWVGGIAGINDDNSTIEYCTNSGSVSGTSYSVGGIAGKNGNSTISYCYYDKQLCTVGGINSSDVSNQAEGKLTTELTGSAPSGLSGDNWTSTYFVFADNMYPRPLGIDTTATAIVCATPLFLAATSSTDYETVDNVATNFTVGMANSVTWASTAGKVSISGGTATIVANSADTLTVTLNNVNKSIVINIASIPLGSEDNPFLIDEVSDLQALATGVNTGAAFTYWNDTTTIIPIGGAGKYFKLTADLDLSGVCGANINGSEVSWTPIGNSEDYNSNKTFQGVFAGDGHTISNLYIKSSDSNYQGLFGFISGASIDSLNLTDVNVSGKNFVGGVCGYAYYYSSISYCTHSGSVSGSYNIGGVCGYAWSNSSISYCTHSGSVSGTGNNVGGVCGFARENSSISYCTHSGSVSGSVSGSNNIGGVCGYAWSNSSISYCTHSGSVSGTDYVGGACGYANYNSSISYCTHSGSVSGHYYVGGVCGYAYNSEISYCAHSGSVSGSYNVGGVSGHNDNSTITSCYYDKQLCTVGGINSSDVSNQAEGKLTTELTGSAPSGLSGDNWTSTYFVFADNMYPRPLGIDTTATAIVCATPLFLAATSSTDYETADNVATNFTMGTDNNVTWASAQSKVSISSGTATLLENGNDTLVASKNGVQKRIAILINGNISSNNIPTIANITAPTAICAGDTLVLSNPTVTSDSAITAEGWQISGDNFNTIYNYTNQMLGDTCNNWNLRYYATNKFGTGYSNSVNIRILTVTISGVDVAIFGSCITLTATTDAQTPTYQWYAGDSLLQGETSNVLTCSIYGTTEYKVRATETATIFVEATKTVAVDQSEILFDCNLLQNVRIRPNSYRLWHSNNGGYWSTEYENFASGNGSGSQTDYAFSLKPYFDDKTLGIHSSPCGNYTVTIEIEDPDGVRTTISSLTSFQRYEFNLGISTVFYTFSDNIDPAITNTCEQTVTVYSGTAPMFENIPSDTILYSNADCEATMDFILAQVPTAPVTYYREVKYVNDQTSGCNATYTYNNLNIYKAFTGDQTVLCYPYAVKLVKADGTSILCENTYTNADTVQNKLVYHRKYNPETICQTDVMSSLQLKRTNFASLPSCITDPFQPGINKLIWYIENATGEKDSCFTIIEVRDTIDPAIVCGNWEQLKTFYADASCEVAAAQLGLNTPTVTDLQATDNCTASSDINISWKRTFNGENPTTDLSAPFIVGTTIIEWMVSDESGNTTSCYQTIEVIDTTGPNFDCSTLSDLNVDADGNCEATAASVIAAGLVTPEAADDSCSPTGATIPAVGARSDGRSLFTDSYPIGTTTITWTFTDVVGNTTVCTRNVSVTDNVVPVFVDCDNLTDIVISLTAEECSASLDKVRAALGSHTAEDNCTGTIDGVPMLMLPDGSLTALPSTFKKDTTYVIVWVFEDESGNRTECNQNLIIKDVTPPDASIVCPNPTKTGTASVSCTVGYSDLDLPIITLDDPCDGTLIPTVIGQVTQYDGSVATYIDDELQGAEYPVGVHTFYWIFTDKAGLKDTCKMTLTVEGHQYIIPDLVTVCHNELPYTWRGTDYSVPGVYYDTLQTSAGCDSVMTLYLTINALPPVPEATSTISTNCLNNGTITVTSPIGTQFEYSINDIDYQSSVLFSALQRGNYTLTVHNLLTGCTNSSIIVVGSDQILPVITITGENTLFLTDRTTLTATGGVTYIWSCNDVGAQIVGLTDNDSVVEITPSDTGYFQCNVLVTSENGCVVSTFYNLKVLPCGSQYPLHDVNHNEYATRVYNHTCWMTENLRVTDYADGTQIPMAVGYWSEMYPNVDANIAIYGRLYDLASATRSETTLPIQGACPEGWQLPTQAEYMSVAALYENVRPLQSADYWLNNIGTNVSEFDMRPSGIYSATAQRYEDLNGNSYFFVAENVTETTSYITIPTCRYSCPELLFILVDRENRLSVRCVKTVR